MKIKAKMKCDQVAKNAYGQEQVELSVVIDGSADNASFSKATPSGHTHLTIDNPDALGAFEPGKEYFVDFTPATT